MEEKKQNEELQSRREFFKEAAKKALPVIGAIALASSPIIAHAAEKSPMGCQTSCYNSCKNTCSGCSGMCKDGCSGCGNACYQGCAAGCTGGCKGNCRNR